MALNCKSPTLSILKTGQCNGHIKLVVRELNQKVIYSILVPAFCNELVLQFRQTVNNDMNFHISSTSPISFSPLVAVLLSPLAICPFSPKMPSLPRPESLQSESRISSPDIRFCFSLNLTLVLLSVYPSVPPFLINTSTSSKPYVCITL